MDKLAKQVMHARGDLERWNRFAIERCLPSLSCQLQVYYDLATLT